MAGAGEGRPSRVTSPDEARRRRRRRGLLAGALASLGAALAAGRLLRRGGGGGGGGQGHVQLDPETVSVDEMFKAFLSNRQYLLASGWHLEQGTFAPGSGAGGKSRGARLLRAVTWPARFAGRGLAGVARPLARAAGSVGRGLRRVGRGWRPPHWVAPLGRRAGGLARRLSSPVRRLRERRARLRAARAARRAASRAGSEPGERREQQVPKQVVDFRKETVWVPPGCGCGGGQVRETHHISATFPGIEPKFLMEVMTSPAYGVKWNPAVRDVVLRQVRRVRRDQVLPQVFTAEAVRAGRGLAPPVLQDAGSDVFDVTAQVTEIPIPRLLVAAAGGRRYSADFVATRFDCQALRGFTLATSIGTEPVAEAAEVRKGQELCLSAMMIAPVETGAWNGTRLHIVSHFDPQAPAAFGKVVHSTVGQSLKYMLSAMHRKALSVQATGKHPYIDCP